MVDRKLFKTKLCVLYQRGHCNRQSCSFAHGNAELRRFIGSGNGRRDYRGGDLRDKLGRRYSPRRRYSPAKDVRSHHAFHGYSPSRSPDDNSVRKRRKKQHLDGQSDVSDFKYSDGPADHVKGGKSAYQSNYALLEQLKQARSDISMLDHHRNQLGLLLEEQVQEADSLSSKIQELEGQLYKEKKECKRITSKIKKFIKAHQRYSRLQDEMKRSELQLQNLADQLGMDAIGTGANEEDSSINIVSDGEHDHFSPVAGMLGVKQAGTEILRTHGRLKFQLNAYPPEVKNDKAVEVGPGQNDAPGLVDEGKNKREKNVSSMVSADKVQMKGLVTGLTLPPTGMAAHALDEVVDIEEENVEAAELPSIGNESAAETKKLPLLVPPLPPVHKNSYIQYQGHDENVDLEVLDEETVNVSIV